MFDIGFWEMLVIFVLGLVVLGPERLPRALRTLGRLLGRARTVYNAMRNEIERELDVQELRETRQQVQREFDSVSQTLEEPARDLRELTEEDLLEPLPKPAADKTETGQGRDSG